jgi:hypothetical protein
MEFFPFPFIDGRKEFFVLVDCHSFFLHMPCFFFKKKKKHTKNKSLGAKYYIIPIVVKDIDYFFPLINVQNEMMYIVYSKQVIVKVENTSYTSYHQISL